MKDAERIRAHILSLSSDVTSLHNEYVDLPAGADATGRFARAESGGKQYVRVDQQTKDEPLGMTGTNKSAEQTSNASLSAGVLPPAEPKIEIRARTRDFFLYGLTQNKVLAGFAILFWLLVTFGEFFGDWFYQQLGGIAANTGDFISRSEMAAVIAICMGLFLVYYILVNLISVLYAIVRFYNFRVSREGNTIHVEYGLISVKSYTMPLRNIHAIIVKQNLLRQWLKQCSVELVSIGYGDEKNEVALLFPMIPLANLDDALGKLLEEYQGTRERTKASPAAKLYFLTMPVILLSLVTVIASFGSQKPLLMLSLLVTMPLLIYARLLYARHAGIGYSEDRLEIATGGFNYQEYRIRMAAVQSVSTNSTFLTEHAGLRNYRIDYHAPAIRAITRVRFLSEHHLEELRRLLDQ